MGKYSRVAQALEDRLAFHMTAGQLLDGYKLIPAPLATIEGRKDFPFVGIWLPGLTESYRTDNIDPSMEIRITVSIDRRQGIATFLNELEKVLDALETAHDGTGNLDKSLGGTICSPFNVSLTNLPLDISYVGNITLAVKPKPSIRGGRRI